MSLFEMLTPDARVYIYGAGGRGEALLHLLEICRPDVEVAGFLDTYKSDVFCGLSVIKFEEFGDREFDQIIVASLWEAEIVSSLKANGMSALSFSYALKDWEEKYVQVAYVLPCWDNVYEPQVYVDMFHNADRITDVVVLEPFSPEPKKPYGLLSKLSIKHISAVNGCNYDAVHVPVHDNLLAQVDLIDGSALAGLPFMSEVNLDLYFPIRKYLGRLNAARSLNVLEIGTLAHLHKGYKSTVYLAHALSADSRFVSLDINPDSVMFARTIAEPYHDNLEVVQSNILEPLSETVTENVYDFLLVHLSEDYPDKNLALQAYQRVKHLLNDRHIVMFCTSFEEGQLRLKLLSEGYVEDFYNGFHCFALKGM